MKIFAIGDPHLSLDPAIEKPMDIFGGKWHEHDKKLKAFWEETVTDDDYVIVAGDISWGMKMEEAKADLDFIHELPGKKLLFKGNHDLWWQSLKKVSALYDDGRMTFMQNNAIKVGDIAICGTRGWTCPQEGTDFTEHDELIYKREVGRLKLALESAKKTGASEIIAVLHFPPTNDKHEASDFTKLLTDYGVKLCVYGHLHGGDGFARGLKGEFYGVEYKLISLDYLGAKPLLLQEV